MSAALAVYLLLRGYRAHLVEDDLDVREAMADLLACEGLRVVIAGDGRVAKGWIYCGLG
jgi:DNA-binding response OmpR family regulator